MTTGKLRQLSHSKLATLPNPLAPDEGNACARKYAYSYVWRVPRAADASAIAGTAFHAALQEDGAHKLVNNIDLSYGELLKHARMVLDLEIKKLDAGYLDRDNMIARLESMLRVYHQKIQPFYAPSRMPEQHFDYREIEGVAFVGYVDAFFSVREDSTFDIGDWKNTKYFRNPKWIGTRFDKDWIDDPDHAAQATAYMMAYPQASAVRFLVFACDPLYPDRAEYKRYTIARDATREADYKRRIVATVESLEEMEATGNYNATVSNLCAYCPFVGVCKAGQAALAAMGKEAQVETPRHEVKCAACEDDTAIVTGYIADEDGARHQVTCRSCGVVAEQPIAKGK